MSVLLTVSHIVAGWYVLYNAAKKYSSASSLSQSGQFVSDGQMEELWVYVDWVFIFLLYIAHNCFILLLSVWKWMSLFTVMFLYCVIPIPICWWLVCKPILCQSVSLSFLLVLQLNTFVKANILQKSTCQFVPYLTFLPEKSERTAACGSYLEALAPDVMVMQECEQTHRLLQVEPILFSF